MSHKISFRKLARFLSADRRDFDNALPFFFVHQKPATQP
jgi:hypothetical protein